MINRKVSVLAGLFLSLIAGTGIAAEKTSADKIGQGVFPGDFTCSRYFPADGEYIGKFVYSFSVDSWGYNWYWFTSLNSDDAGCVGIEKTVARHDKIAYDAFAQSKIVKIRLDKNRITGIIQ
ncbi:MULTISPECIES: hypothetical protein [Photorhabdus]|uniref:Uncharacterized protein n=2 Tax=Photorhabdus asymbiotica TaxID=291112 RepID=B6VL67_PHOAA|nr:hypothetical protein [Photorhabdus asymbiotica]RKS57142.1 hypothetical protein BDD30_3783 [Photorhabdus asymbiotica]CAQ84502.1 Hypothetical protein PAU_02410 [Photorhabdus asymbiotica]CAR66897.1 Hypothetical protein PA-RVA6-3068 [Photorhabdus asymbiotica subsp. asymbiotica ATCC 43949]